MTGNEIIKEARKYLGWNGKKFCNDYGMMFGNHWCCAFVWDIFRMAKASKLFYGGQKTAYVPTAQMWLAANCEHVSMKDAKPGDIIVFTWSGNGYNHEHGSRDHIGLIRKKGTASTAFTIEGNTGGTSPMNSKVMERERALQFVFGIYRPKYETKKAVQSDDKKKTGNQSSGKKKTAEQTKNKAEQSAKKGETVRIDAEYIVVSKIGMNIRKKPDKSSKRLGGVGYGRKLKATKKKDDWVYVKYGKIKGWMKTRSGSVTYLRKI